MYLSNFKTGVVMTEKASFQCYTLSSKKWNWAHLQLRRYFIQLFSKIL